MIEIENIKNINLTLSTLEPSELLKLSKNQYLNSYSLILSCFDPKNISKKYDDIFVNSYQHNNILYIDNNNNINTLSYNALYTNNYFGIDDTNNIIQLAIDQNTLYDKNNSLNAYTKNYKLSGKSTGLFTINYDSLNIENNTISLASEYSSIIDNFKTSLNIMLDINNKAVELIDNINKLKQFKYIKPVIKYSINPSFNEPIIYEDNKSFIEISNTINEEADCLLPQYYIDDDITEFNIGIPMTFKYSSSTGFPNYQSFFDKDIISVDIYKMNIKQNIDYELLNQYFEDFKSSIFDIQTIYSFFDFTKTNVCIYNKDKSYVKDININTISISNDEDMLNRYSGSFLYYMNFAVNYKSNFDYVKLNIKLHKDSENPDLIIILRFINDEISNMKCGQILYHNYNSGYNYNGDGTAIGIYGIPNDFYSSSEKYKSRKKPIFVKLSDNQSKIKKLSNNNNDFYKTTIDLTTNITTNIKNPFKDIEVFNNLTENSDLTQQQYIYTIPYSPLKFKYLRYYNTNEYWKYDEYISPNKFIYYSLIFNSNQIQLNNNISLLCEDDLLNDIYDYEFYGFKRSGNHNVNDTSYWYYGYDGINDIYSNNIIRDITNPSFYPKFNDLEIFENTLLDAFNPKEKFSLEIQKTVFNTIYNKTMSGIRKGDCYPASLQEIKILNELNIFKIHQSTIYSCVFSKNNNDIYYYGINNVDLKTKYIKTKLNTTQDESTGIWSTKMNNMLPLFKIPDFNILNSDNYYMYYDDQLNYEVIDYNNDNFNGNFILNIQNNTEYANISHTEFASYSKDNSIEILQINSLNYIHSNWTLTIKTKTIKGLKGSILILYKDSESDMNNYELNNKKYRILCEIFIKK